MAPLYKLLRFLSRISTASGAGRARIVAAVAASILGGIASTGFVVLINSILGGGRGWRELLGFVALCILLPLFRFLSNILLSRLTEVAQFELRTELSRRILATSLRRVEEVGPSRLMAALTDDVATITGALANMPLILMHLTVVLGCLAYMGWLSWKLLLLVLGFLAVGILTYRIPHERARHYLQLSREAWNRQFRHFRGLTDGIKELKLHEGRRAAFLAEDLIASGRERMGHRQQAIAIQALAASWGQILFFIVIGLVLFVIPAVGAFDQRLLVGYTLAILYMLTPLDFILNNLIFLNTGAVAVEQVEKLGLSLAEDSEVAAGTQPRVRPGGWRRIELVGVTHTYRRDNEDEMFTLGAIDLSLVPGECVFLVGGNGSGKTTLAKLLTGLYVPEEGGVRLDGKLVGDADRERYRQMFSAVFSDFYLFDRLLGIDASRIEEQTRGYLEKLHLAGKVAIQDGCFSTLELSQGQRKRLALLAAYLEDRPIYLFDEWAADQDPMFKKIFYCQLLPELKARGKTVIVISHDDRYYSVADRLIRLESGRIVGSGDDGGQALHGHSLPNPAFVESS